MRKRFEIQYELGATPIENLEIPLRSRDEMPPVLRALQYIYTTPELNQRVFEILEAKVLHGKKKTGRQGMTLWEILVLATVRLARDVDYDALHYMSNSDMNIRGLLGICKFGKTAREYSLQSLKDNIDLLDDEMLEQINDLVVEAGHQLIKKKDEKLNVKVDSYVLETTVRFPTDINLLFDAARKSLQLAQRLAVAFRLPGWRKAQYWINQFKSHARQVGKLFFSGGKNKQEKLQQATQAYLQLARQLSQKLDAAEVDFQAIEQASDKQKALLDELKYFKGHLDNQIHLVTRRILFGETIPHAEKVFSFFEP
ncbi:ISNCY family transposase, partial [candidate division KSB1 bacterium]|nr:ISNCY family transposase [candidate division KSB1 bacterium]